MFLFTASMVIFVCFAGAGFWWQSEKTSAKYRTQFREEYPEASECHRPYYHHYKTVKTSRDDLKYYRGLLVMGLALLLPITPIPLVLIALITSYISTRNVIIAENTVRIGILHCKYLHTCHRGTSSTSDRFMMYASAVWNRDWSLPKYNEDNGFYVSQEKCDDILIMMQALEYQPTMLKVIVTMAIHTIRLFGIMDILAILLAYWHQDILNYIRLRIQEAKLK